MSIYQHVQAACREKGISVNSLEDKLNFPRGCIYKWDKHRPAVDRIYAVAKELKKPIEYFLKE